MGTETLGATGASIVRAYLISCIPLFIKAGNYSTKLKAEGYNEEQIKVMIEDEFGDDLNNIEKK